MKKKNLIGAAILSLSLALNGMTMVPVYADGTKVVTLGADLSDAQKQTMMKYFRVNANEVQILTITNADERAHLSGYVPMEQIGTRTVSCAYVKPTNSGGIKVRTANLNWVTGNMIASSLSTSGVRNCEVIAACPFEVSGTGALTGIQMAYETATGTKLDPSKKELATQEIVVTGNLADDLGRTDATAVINDSKIDVIQNNITDYTEITNIVTNIANQNNVTLSQEQLDEIVALLQQIANEGYNYEDVADTLENVEQNTSGETPEETDAEDDEEEGDSIIVDLDDSVLGDNVVASSTEDQSLEENTYDNTDAEDDGFEVFDEGDMDADTDSDDENVIIEEPTDDGDVVEVDGDLSETDDSEKEQMLQMLSEQTKSQYDKAVKFVEGEFGGDAEALREAMGDDAYAAIVLSEITDDETIKKLEDAVTDYYLEILAKGTGSYVPNGLEKYMSVELCMMDEYLQKLFEIDDATLDTTDEDILATLTSDEKQALYNDTIAFFEKLYGETSFTDDNTNIDTAEEDTESYEEQPYEEESYETDDYAEEYDFEETDW